MHSQVDWHVHSPHRHCNRTHTNIGFRAHWMLPKLFQSNLLCAGYAAGSQGSCKGDSGGPLVKYDTKGAAPHYIQVGMVQGGIAKCGDQAIPSIYIRLEDFEVWNFIQESMGKRTRPRPTTATRRPFWFTTARPARQETTHGVLILIIYVFSMVSILTKVVEVGKGQKCWKMIVFITFLVLKP